MDQEFGSIISQERRRRAETDFWDRTCAIIGGVLTIAGLVDSFIFNGAKRLKGEGDTGFAGPGGKMVCGSRPPELSGKGMSCWGMADIGPVVEPRSSAKSYCKGQYLKMQNMLLVPLNGGYATVIAV